MIKEIIKNWVIPPGYIKIFNQIKKKTEAPFDPGLFKKNIQFKARHIGERCFILASGPSVKHQDLSPLIDEICIAVSHFHLHPLIKEIKPAYHVLAPQHFPFDFKDSSKYFEDFIKAYSDFQPHIFLGLTPYTYNYLELLKHYPKFNIANINYINYSNGRQIDETNYLNRDIWDIAASPFSIRTVLYSAIQIAVYMGFKEIYLIGADHDYLNDTTRTTNHHFYAEEKGISDHKHLVAFSTERWFAEYYNRWKDYRLIKEYCSSSNICIYNSTKGGMLDVFERIPLASIKK